MLITARKAREVLVREGVSTWSGQRVLRAGLAGEPVRAGATTCYDEDRVRELAARPSVDWSAVEAACPAGFFVSRREFPVGGTREEQVAALGGDWCSSGRGSMSPWVWVALQRQVDRHGAVPFVATIGGLVVLGAEITATRGLSDLVLGPPGPWFEGLRGCWFPTGRDRPWVLHLAPLPPEKIGA